ncbi:MAG: YkgJ family cysteine cluster protein [Desulfovibrionaceae bacterium]
MALDFCRHFEEYEKLVAEVDLVFCRISETHPEQVRCEKGCSDCCYALFDLSLVEALYLNHHFNQNFEGQARSDILERADQADRAVYKVKRNAFKANEEGKPSSEILAELGKVRIRCPLLGEDDLCVLYDHRPITCRVYGLPMAIGGEARTCGKSGFTPGGSYPTVHIERIQDRLLELSQALVAELNTKHARMWDMLIPPSMALLTTFDENYLGVVDEARSEKAAALIGDSPCTACSQNAASCGQDSSSCQGCDPDSQTITIGRTDGKPGEGDRG